MQFREGPIPLGAAWPSRFAPWPRLTGRRSIAEFAEPLRLTGGGVGPFAGRATGATGAALVLDVADR